MDKETKEILAFTLKAIETLSLAIMKEDYDFEEMNRIYEQAGIHLHDVKIEEE